MKYVALLRGINVGGKNKIDMRNLKEVFENLGFTRVSTYINSGNVIFESDKDDSQISIIVGSQILRQFNKTIPVLIKNITALKDIVASVPNHWKNNTQEKTDIAYLFKEIDNENILDTLPIKKEFLNILYTKGAVVWNLKRKDYTNSHLNKLVNHRLYKLMTVRNINTSRQLATL